MREPYGLGGNRDEFGPNRNGKYLRVDQREGC